MADVVRNTHVLHCERGKCYNDRSIDRSIGGVGNSVARHIFPLFVGLGYGCRRNSGFVRPIMVFDINGCGGVGCVLFCCSGGRSHDIK